jgi:hypothetical protein
MKQVVLVHALWRGTREDGTLPVRVSRAYGWLEALGRLAFFDAWVTAAHCGLAGVNSSLPGALRVNRIPLDFNFAFQITPGLGYFVYFIAQVSAQLLGSTVVVQPRRLPHARVSWLSFMAPRLSMPRPPSMPQAGDQDCLALKRTLSREFRSCWKSQVWAKILDYAIIANAIFLPAAFLLPMISIHVRANIEDKFFRFLSVRLHRDLKHGEYSIVSIIWIIGSHGGHLGKLMASSVTVLVVIIPLIRAVLLCVAWYAPVSHQVQTQCAKAASWCGLLASFDVFVIASIVTYLEVPNIFEQTEALFLRASLTPGFWVLFLVALMEASLAATVVRVVAQARAIQAPVGNRMWHG